MRRTTLGGFLLCLIFSLLALGSPWETQALTGASIFVGPASGTFTVGSTFTISVYVNTGGNAVNAIEANLAFPPDKLQVVAPTTGKSLVQIWVSQPTFSNELGTLKFQGTVPSPGINTESGLVSTVTFRVKSTGQAIVKVLDNSRVLLNDGKGTDILGQTASGIYNLILPPPAGPIVASPTHPDQGKWYFGEVASFRWEIPPDGKGFSYVLNNEPVDVPDDISEGLKNSITYRNLKDGIHYFHIKSLREGVWGGVSHYAINFDNTPPASFEIDISPGERTSTRFPIISFETTDRTSGVDHYELKFIPLDRSEDAARAAEENMAVGETPFFIEASSPFSRELSLGKYDVVVRAHDRAGNFYQSTKRLTVTRAIFEVVRGEGLNFRGNFIVPWLWVWILALVLILGLALAGRKIWGWHREVERHLELGGARHPSVVEKVGELKDKLSEYGKKFGEGHSLFTFLILFISGFYFLAGVVFAQTGAERDLELNLEPPLVTLFPESISNDEILYIGGRAAAPKAEVIIYLQDEEEGTALGQSVKTNEDGEWFYSFSNFLDPGRYVIWTQLKLGEELSPPSSKLELEVAKTAVQIGEDRFSYEQIYLWLLLILLLVFMSTLVFTGYHFYHHRLKRKKLLEEIGQAEESVKRGFLLLRRDIEAELNLVHKTKMTKELEAEEKSKEEKLLKDLDWVNSYIGKEVWEVEKEI